MLQTLRSQVETVWRLVHLAQQDVSRGTRVRLLTRLGTTARHAAASCAYWIADSSRWAF